MTGFVFFVAAVFGLLLCCVFVFLFSGRLVMGVSVRVGYFYRSVVRPMGLFYPVPGLVLTGLGFAF